MPLCTWARSLGDLRIRVLPVRHRDQPARVSVPGTEIERPPEDAGAHGFSGALFDLVKQHRIALHGVRDFTDVGFELRGDRLSDYFPARTLQMQLKNDVQPD